MTTRNWLAVLAPLFLVLLAVSACGGDDDDDDTEGSPTSTAALATVQGNATTSPTATQEPAATDQPDSDLALNPCNLVTSTEAAAAVGHATDEPQLDPSIGRDFSQCLWRIQGGSAIDSALVVQVRQSGTSSEEYAELVDENCPDELGEAIPVSGIGDQAYECLALMVLSGDVMFVVTSLSGDPSTDTATQEQLARTIIGRLP